MVRVIHAVSVMDRAGQETFLMNVYRRIDKTRLQFDFQCSINQRGDFDEEIYKMGGEILYLGQNKITFPLLKYAGDVFLQYNFFKDHTEYDVFHIHTYHAFDAFLSIAGAKMAGMKNIVLHSHNSKGLHVGLHKIFRWVLSHVKIKRYACSEMAAEWMYGSEAVSGGMVTIIKNGIEPEEFAFDEEKRDEKRNELGIKNKVVVGHIGRFTTQKNHKFLIDIFCEYSKIEPRAILLLMGAGDLVNEIKERVGTLKLQDKVHFLGVRKDVRELLWAMDTFLFPSLYEGLSVVAVEAQAAGVPILAADTLTQETKLTDCMHFMALENSPCQWAKELDSSVKIGHKNTTAEIKKAGYDILETVQIMSQNYMEYKR